MPRVYTLDPRGVKDGLQKPVSRILDYTLVLRLRPLSCLYEECPESCHQSRDGVRCMRAKNSMYSFYYPNSYVLELGIKYTRKHLEPFLAMLRECAPLACDKPVRAYRLVTKRYSVTLEPGDGLHILTNYNVVSRFALILPDGYSLTIEKLDSNPHTRMLLPNTLERILETVEKVVAALEQGMWRRGARAALPV